MRDDVAEIIENDDPRSAHVTALVAALPDEGALWELMSSYNWDDGFAVPLAVVSHPRCDRALALRMLWELDDTARLHLDDPALTDRQRTLRAAHTKRAQRTFDVALLEPVL